MTLTIARLRRLDKYLSILFYLILISGFKDTRSINGTAPLVCTSEIGNSEILLSDVEEIDLSSISSIIKYKNSLFFTQPFKGGIISYDLIEKSFTQIGREGRGPYEFQNAVLYIQENTLYIQGLRQAKIAEFDLDTWSFRKEYSLNKYIGGLLTRVAIENGTKQFYFTSQRRDRSINNDTFIDLVRYDLNSSNLDTIMTYQDIGRLNHWDNSRKADYSFEALMYKHKKVGELENNLVSIDTDQLVFNFIEKEESSIVIDFSYKPDYDWYVESLVEAISDRNQTFPDLEEKALKLAIRRDTRAFNSLFSRWVLNDSYILLSLFSNKNAHLVYSLRKKEGVKVICAEKNFTPILIDENSIYWIVEGEGYNFELHRTKI